MAYAKVRSLNTCSKGIKFVLPNLIYVRKLLSTENISFSLPH